MNSGPDSSVCEVTQGPSLPVLQKGSSGQTWPRGCIHPVKRFCPTSGRFFSPAWPRSRGKPRPWCMWLVPPSQTQWLNSLPGSNSVSHCYKVPVPRHPGPSTPYAPTHEQGVQPGRWDGATGGHRAASRRGMGRWDQNHRPGS